MKQPTDKESLKYVPVAWDQVGAEAKKEVRRLWQMLEKTARKLLAS